MENPMTWAWDRGRNDSAPAIEVPPSGDLNKYFSQTNQYAKSRTEETARIDELREHPASTALVQPKLKKTLGRTADIPLTCGRDWTHKAIAFGIREGKVELILIMLQYQGPLLGSLGYGAIAEAKVDPLDVWQNTVPDRTECRLTGPDTTEAPLYCRCDHENNKLTRLWLFEQGLKALASDDTKRRPSIQIHAPRR